MAKKKRSDLSKSERLELVNNLIEFLKSQINFKSKSVSNVTIPIALFALGFLFAGIRTVEAVLINGNHIPYLIMTLTLAIFILLLLFYLYKTDSLLRDMHQSLVYIYFVKQEIIKGEDLGKGNLENITFFLKNAVNPQYVQFIMKHKRNS